MGNHAVNAVSFLLHEIAHVILCGVQFLLMSKLCRDDLDVKLLEVNRLQNVQLIALDVQTEVVHRTPENAILELWQLQLQIIS